MSSLWTGRARTCSRMRNGELGLSRTGLQFHRRNHACSRGCVRSPIPTVNSYQAHQRARSRYQAPLGRRTRDLYRQQPHAHDPDSRAAAASSFGWPTAPPTPICCRPRSSPPVSTASREASIPASRSTSTCMPRVTRRLPTPSVAAQPARCFAAHRAVRAVAPRARQRVRQLLHQAQDQRVGRLFAPAHTLGAGDDARLLAGRAHQLRG